MDTLQGELLAVSRLILSPSWVNGRTTVAPTVLPIVKIREASSQVIAGEAQAQLASHVQDRVMPSWQPSVRFCFSPAKHRSADATSPSQACAVHAHCALQILLVVPQYPHAVAASVEPGWQAPAGSTHVLKSVTTLVGLHEAVCVPQLPQARPKIWPAVAHELPGLGSGTQAAAFAVMLVSPAGQAAHWRSAPAVPAALTMVPGAHVLHAAQLVALAVVLNVPFAHAAHVRSVVVPPPVVTASPGVQLVHATHTVADVPS